MSARNPALRDVVFVDGVPFVWRGDLTPAERILRQLECGLRAIHAPWAITWHALERYIERFHIDLSYEDAMARLADDAREASYTGVKTREGHDVWVGGGLRFVVAAETSAMTRGALVTVLPEYPAAVIAGATTPPPALGKRGRDRTSRRVRAARRLTIADDRALAAGGEEEG